MSSVRLQIVAHNGLTFAQVVLSSCTKKEDGTTYLTPQMTIPEVEGDIDRLIDQLNSLKKKAKPLMEKAERDLKEMNDKNGFSFENVIKKSCNP